MRYGARSLSLSARRSRASLRSAFISAADTLKPSSIQMSASPNENTVPPHFLSLKRAREVKLTCADGTAMQCGRVGSRLLLSRASDFERFLRLFCFLTAFSSALSFSHRFHRCSQIFLLLYLFPTDFTDAHRFLFFVDEKDFVRNLFCFSLV